MNTHLPGPLWRVDARVVGAGTVDVQHIAGHALFADDKRLGVHLIEDVEPGQELEVVLSLGALVNPATVEARVLAQHAPRGHGKPGTVELAIASQGAGTEKLRERLRPAHALSTCRMLVVEDSKLVRTMIEFKLSRALGSRLELVVATDLATAQSELERARFDLLLIDHLLPDGKGADLVAELRTQASANSEAVIIANSVGGREVRDQNLAAGADIFIDKPLDLPRIVATVDWLCEVPARRV